MRRVLLTFSKVKSLASVLALGLLEEGLHRPRQFLKVEVILPEGVQLGQVDIWFQDEMRIGQRGTQTRLWERKGTRPRVVRQQQSESA